MLVAEVMLQQTQAPRVAPRWEDFLRRWPSPSSLAGTPLGDLLVWWQGLGYPRRAANLHSAAEQCVRLHAGTVPRDLDGLLALRGVGPYTARAVLAFAFEEGVGVVDTNIARVLARVSGRTLRASDAQLLADKWVPVESAWAWNQSLMDIGAMRCRPTPDCCRCPLATSCSWALAGCPTPDPALSTAGVSRPQAPYRGSDRELRGAVLRVLAAGQLEGEELFRRVRAEIADRRGVGSEGPRLDAVLESLRSDGLVEIDAEGLLRLPR